MSLRGYMVWFVALFIVVGLIAPANAGLVLGISESTTLDKLLEPGASLQVGDKIFENWQYRVIKEGDPTIIPAGSIDILFDYDEVAKIVSIGYHVGYKADAGEKVDALWTYTVRTESGAPLIKDVSANLIAGIADPPGVPGGPEVSLVERIYEGADDTGAVLATIGVSDTDPYERKEWSPGVSQIYVFKNLLLDGGNIDGGFAHVSWLDQEVSQVPEASSFALFGLGLIGLGLGGRRFRRRSE